MIFEESYDTEDCWKFSFVSHKYYIFKYIQIENSFF